MADPMKRTLANFSHVKQVSCTIFPTRKVEVDQRNWNYFRKIIEKKLMGRKFRGGAFKGARGGVLGGGALIKGAHLELGR